MVTYCSAEVCNIFDLVERIYVVVPAGIRRWENLSFAVLFKTVVIRHSLYLPCH